MNDADAMLRVDAILGRTAEGASGRSNEQIQTAQFLVQMDDRDRDLPSQHFRERLKSELFASPSPTLAAPSAPKRSIPGPLPDERSSETHLSANRLVAIAAVLALVLTGAGVVFEGSLRTSHAPEPSPIPAVSFASPTTVEATPQLPVWTANAPEGAGVESANHLVAGGRIFRAFDALQGFPYLQAIDAKTGALLWKQMAASEAGIMVASDDVLAIAEFSSTPENPDPVHRLVGLDARNGIRRWEVGLPGPPVAAALMGDRVMVLGWNNTLDAIGIEDGKQYYSLDYSGSVQLPQTFPADLANFTFNPGRIATVGTTVAIVLADGSVIALDGETGHERWQVERILQGEADVYAVGDRLVISIVKSNAAAADGTPLPSVWIPTEQLSSTYCDTGIWTFLAGDKITAATSFSRIGELYAVDPETGILAWSGTTELFLGLTSPSIRISDGSLLLDTTAQNQGTTTPGKQCVIDVGTGTITPLTEPASHALGSFINNVGNGGILETVAVFDDGEFVAYPATEPDDSTKPVFDLSPYLASAAYWIQFDDGAFYISMSDGTLMKFDPAT